jgi:hypothetical protein
MACDPNECSELLPKLKAAYYALLSGDRKTSFRYRERTITYQAATPAIMAELKNEIMRLETKCGCGANGRRRPLRLGRVHRRRCC